MARKVKTNKKETTVNEVENEVIPEVAEEVTTEQIEEKEQTETINSFINEEIDKQINSPELNEVIEETVKEVLDSPIFEEEEINPLDAVDELKETSKVLEKVINDNPKLAEVMIKNEMEKLEKVTETLKKQSNEYTKGNANLKKPAHKNYKSFAQFWNGIKYT